MMFSKLSVALGTLTLVCLLGAGCAKTTTPPQNSIPQGFKEYKNVSEKYSVLYPEDFQVQENQEIVEEVRNTGTTFSFPQNYLIKTIPEAKMNISSQEADACADPSKEKLAEKKPDVTKKGTTYSVYTWGDAAAGSQYGGTVYMTYKNNRCYRIGLFTHTTTPANYAGSMEESQTLQAEHDATLSGLNLIFEKSLATFTIE